MRKIRGLTALLLVIFTLALLLPTKKAEAAADYSWVKVKLTTNNATSLTMYLTGSYFIAENGVECNSNTLTVRVNGAGSLTVLDNSTMAELYTGSSFSLKRANVDRSAGLISLNSRRYLGHMNFRCTSSGYIQVVNEVPLAHYLYGVVGYEMSNTFPMEALKAQAVAAKCYVINQMSTGGEYYIGDTSADQVYKGYNSAYASVIAAVDATLTEVLTYGGNIMCSYYAASNGGETNYPTYAWPGQGRSDRGYGIALDDFDLANPYSNIEVVSIPIGNVQSYATTTALAYLLLKAQQATGDTGVNYVETVYSAEVGGPAYSGTARNLTVGSVTMKVCAVDLTGSVVNTYDNINVQFRLSELYTYGVVKNASLRIYWGEYNTAGNIFYIYHARWGHGVGMSQRGAQQRALSGHSYRDILSFYYPKASFSTINVTPPANPVNDSKLPSGDYAVAETTGNVNFRKSATASSSRLATIPTGATVAVYSSASGWAYAVYNNVAGYISEDYLKYTSGAVPTTTPGGDSTVAYGKINGSGVKFRKGPATSYGYYEALARNTDVTVTGQTGDWYNVTVNGVSGYVYSTYVSITGYATAAPTTDAAAAPGFSPVPVPSATPTPTPAATGPAVIAYGSVTGSGVNFRTGPATSYTSYGKLVRGTTLDIYSQTGGWFYARVADGTIGYISSGYVKVVGYPTPTPAGATPAPGATATPGAAATPGASASPSATPATTAVKTGVISGSGVNFRSGPSTAYDSLGKLNKNTGAYVISEIGVWSYVLINGQQGYVHSDYVNITGSAQLDASGKVVSGDTQDGTGKGVTTGNVNLRKGPSTSYQSMGKLIKGTSLTILGEQDGWYSVKTATGASGYVSGKYVSITQAVSGATTVGEAESSTVIGTGVTTATVNFRVSPSTSSKKLGQLKTGAAVTLYSLANGWYGVEYNGTRGYLYAQYVRQLTVAASPSPTASPSASVSPGVTITPGITASPAAFATPSATANTSGVVTVAAGRINSQVNLRNKPSTSGTKVLATLDAGVTLQVLGITGDWYYVLYNGQIGFISKSYLTVTSAGTVGVPTLPSTVAPAQANSNGRLILFSSPSKSAKPAQDYPSNVAVMLYYQLDGWCLASVDGAFGFVEFSY